MAFNPSFSSQGSLLSLTINLVQCYCLQQCHVTGSACDQKGVQGKSPPPGLPCGKVPACEKLPVSSLNDTQSGSLCWQMTR